MAETDQAHISLPPTGDRTVTPPLRGSRGSHYRVQVEGVYRFEHPKLGSEAFDAVYRSGKWGSFSRRHEYLDWGPTQPRLLSEDPGAHRYVFELPASGASEGDSIGVRLNLDRFVDEYLIPPSEIRGALSGELRMTVMASLPPPPSSWGLVTAPSIAAAVVVGSIGFVMRRRMALRGVPEDLQEAVLSIDQKYRSARAAVGTGHARLFPLRDRLTGLHRGAFALAREVHALRGARCGLDRPGLEREISSLVHRIEILADADAARETACLLRERRKSVELLTELERAETLAETRLGRISAALDTACLTLRAGSLLTADPQASGLLQSLDAELAAIREVERELPALRRSG